MRIYSDKITENGLHGALRHAQDAGLVHRNVEFAQFNVNGSRTHKHRYDVQLGSYDHCVLPGATNQYGKPQKTRRVRNSNYGDQRFSATWHEWGWFIAELYRIDPDARIGWYENVADFDEKTNWQFTS